MSPIYATAEASGEQIVADICDEAPSASERTRVVENDIDEDWALGVRVGALCDQSMEIVESSRAILKVRDKPQDG